MKNVFQGVITLQTDTTVGFLSRNREILRERKERQKGKEFLQVVASFRESKEIGRVPKKFSRYFRFSQKRSFIFKNSLSVRVVKDKRHSQFLKRYGKFYSSSANLSGKKFQRDIAIELSDAICEDSRGLFEDTPSQIIKIGREKIKRLR